MADRFVKDAQLEIELLPAQDEVAVLLPKQVLRQITINLVKNCAVHANASRLRISMAYTVRGNKPITKFCSKTTVRVFPLIIEVKFSSLLAVAFRKPMEAGLVWRFAVITPDLPYQVISRILTAN